MLNKCKCKLAFQLVFVCLMCMSKRRITKLKINRRTHDACDSNCNHFLQSEESSSNKRMHLLHLSNWKAIEQDKRISFLLLESTIALCSCETKRNLSTFDVRVSH